MSPLGARRRGRSGPVRPRDATVRSRPQLRRRRARLGGASRSATEEDRGLTARRARIRPRPHASRRRKTRARLPQHAGAFAHPERVQVLLDAATCAGLAIQHPRLRSARRAPEINAEHVRRSRDPPGPRVRRASSADSWRASRLLCARRARVPRLDKPESEAAFVGVILVIELDGGGDPSLRWRLRPFAGPARTAAAALGLLRRCYNAQPSSADRRRALVSFMRASRAPVGREQRYDAPGDQQLHAVVVVAQAVHVQRARRRSSSRRASSPRVWSASRTGSWSCRPLVEHLLRRRLEAERMTRARRPPARRAARSAPARRARRPPGPSKARR